MRKIVWTGRGERVKQGEGNERDGEGDRQGAWVLRGNN